MSAVSVSGCSGAKNHSPGPVPSIWLGIDVKEIRTLLGHPDVVALLGGDGSEKKKPDGPNRPTDSRRGTQAVGNRLRPTPEQTAVSAWSVARTGLAAEYLDHRKIEDDAQRSGHQ